MTRMQFAKEGNTYTIKHSTDLEAYRQKVEGIVKGEANNSQKINVRRASKRLFGAKKMSAGLAETTRTGVESARRNIFDEPSQTKEGEDVTND